MRFRVLLPLLCAASASAGPLLAPRLHKGLTPAEICALKWTDVSTDTAKATWENSGAQDWLQNFLKTKGTQDFANKFFASTEFGGNQGGSTHNCVSFPGGGSCGGPDDGCPTYNPPEAFFVHLSISQLYGAFDRVHESIQNDMVDALLGDVQTAVSKFAPPPVDDSFILTLMIGAFVGAAAMCGPIWQFGVAMTGVVGGLNWAAGINSAAAKPLTPDDYDKFTREQMEGLFNGIEDALKKTVDAVFGGNFDAIGFKGDENAKIDWIMDKFADGKMLDNTKVNPQMDTYTNATETMIKQGIVVSCLKAGKYYVWEDTDIKSEADCKSQSKRVWMNNRCTSLVSDQGSSMTGYFPTVIDDDRYKALTQDYGIDYQKALQNAVDCSVKSGSAGPDWGTLPPFNQPQGWWPACFFNLEVHEKGFYGGQPSNPGPSWQSGWCGLHITQYQKPDPSKDHYHLTVLIKDANGKVIGNKTNFDAPAQQKIDVDSALPYVLEVTAGNVDNDPVMFDYAGQHWGTNDQAHHCDFGAYDSGKREGDCGFNC